tara:strand:- start:221 stop:976 length:756 start_codon:yes stop_codon:yes gene_type:complete
LAKPRGFTLIELLVVISIIALLVGILLPALSRAKDAAVDTQCKVRVSQVFVAQTMYATDHGVFTSIWNKDNGSFSESGPEPARTQLGEYLSVSDKSLESSESALQCPSISEDDLTIFDDQFYGARPSSIGTNSAMYFRQWESIPERVPNTSGIIVVAEQAVEPYEEVLSADGVVARRNGALAYWQTVSNHQPDRGYRHGGKQGNNVAMADGHVECLAHEHLNHESGYWFWWDSSNDMASMSTEEQACGCPQ